MRQTRKISARCLLFRIVDHSLSKLFDFVFQRERKTKMKFQIENNEKGLQNICVVKNSVA